MSTEKQSEHPTVKRQAVGSSDLLAVTKLKCRNGDSLDALEDKMVELTLILAKHAGELAAAEASIQWLRDRVESAEIRKSNLETRMHIWHTEHGEKLRALTANDPSSATASQ